MGKLTEKAKQIPAADAVGDQLAIEEQSGNLTLTALSPRIKTVEEALEFGQVDRTVWEVESYQITSWEVGMKVEAVVGNKKITRGAAVTPLWRIAIKLRRIVPKVIEDATTRFFARMREGLPKVKAKALPKISGHHLAELSIYDHHFGKLAWAPETGNNYDLSIAERLYANAVDDLLAYWNGVDIERYIFPVGHDLLHIDSQSNATTAGTPQDVDGRFAKIIECAFESVSQAVEKIAERSHVEVIHVPGNHDWQTSWWLVKCIAERYRGHKRVTVDYSPRDRKYRRHGVNLFCYTHGDKIKKLDRYLAAIASEQPEAFAQCTNKQLRLGHYHRKGATHTVGQNHVGDLEVNYMPSMCGTDKWHHEQGYVSGRRAAEVWLWHRERGYVGHFSAPARLS